MHGILWDAPYIQRDHEYVFDGIFSQFGLNCRQKSSTKPLLVKHLSADSNDVHRVQRRRNLDLCVLLRKTQRLAHISYVPLLWMGLLHAFTRRRCNLDSDESSE